MANSTTSLFIKPTVAFNRGDTFVFGSLVCTAKGAVPSNAASPCHPTQRRGS
jgi:hypothetical protein